CTSHQKQQAKEESEPHTRLLARLGHRRAQICSCLVVGRRAPFTPRAVICRASGALLCDPGTLGPTLSQKRRKNGPPTAWKGLAAKGRPPAPPTASKE